jgi:CheY-like chemotaxis protein
MSRRGTLLCIDDDPACLKVRKLLLEHFGYKVRTSTSGRDGLRLFQSRRFDAVLLDYQMPGMNGAQVATEMRRLNPKVPIIMLSAYTALPESATRLVNAFVSKTEPTTYLLRKLEQLQAFSAQPDPIWLLAAALGTTALLALALQKLLRPRRPIAEVAPSAMPKTA